MVIWQRKKNLIIALLSGVIISAVILGSILIVEVINYNTCREELVKIKNEQKGYANIKAYSLNADKKKGDLITEAEALPVLKDLAVSVGRRLRKAGQKAGMVSVEIKYHTFNQVSHQKQMERQTNHDQEIYQASLELFRELWSGEPIRLHGIRTSKLSEESEPEQLRLFDMKFESEETRKKKKNLKEALKKLEGKYGDGIVKKGW